MNTKEYCPYCDHYIDVIPVMKIGIIQWVCHKCGQVIDEDYEEDYYEYD